MPRYNMTMPTFKGKFSAVNRRDAIDQAIKIWRLLMEKMILNGDIYKVPDIAIMVKDKTDKDALDGLGHDQPLKPSRWGKKRKR